MQMQSIYTNPEQAKRLLDAGLPKDTADCYQMTTGYGFDLLVIPTGKLYFQMEYHEQAVHQFDSLGILPCWSLGRLIELATRLLADNATRHLLAHTSLSLHFTPTMLEDMLRWFEFNQKTFDYAPLRPTIDPEPVGTIIPEAVAELKRKQEALNGTIPPAVADTLTNFELREYGTKCPIAPDKAVCEINCRNCPHYVADSTRSVICKKVLKPC